MSHLWRKGNVIGNVIWCLTVFVEKKRVYYNMCCFITLFATFANVNVFQSRAQGPYSDAMLHINISCRKYFVQYQALIIWFTINNLEKHIFIPSQTSRVIRIASQQLRQQLKSFDDLSYEILPLNPNKQETIRHLV